VVTVGEFRAFVAATGRDRGGTCWYYKDESDEWIERKGKYFDDPGFTQTDQSPAVCLNFADGQAYAEWLTQKTGVRYRLPSEAEWEYAARAGSKAARFWGNALDLQCTFANGADESYHNTFPQDPGYDHFCDDGYVKTAPVASFKPNRFGLYDMLGNSWQMTEDCSRDDYSNAPTDGAPVLGTCEKQVIRGGSWARGPQFLRSAARGRIAPDIRSISNSIRLVREM
jgi:formylglycine-generating enzyme required for sulfatase activity